MTTEKKLVIKINCQSPKQEKNIAEKNQQHMITEWNVKRIGIAGLILLLIILVPVSMLLINDDKDIISVNDNTKPELINRNALQQDIEQTIITETNIEQANNQIDSSQQVENKVVEPKQPLVLGNTKKPDQDEKNQINNKSVAREKVSPNQKQKTTQLANGLARAQLANTIKNKEPVGKVKLPFKADEKYAKGIFYFTELRGLKGKVVYHEWLHNGNLIYKRRINILGNRWRASTRKMMQYKSTGSWQVRLIDQDGNLMHEIKFEVVG